MVTYNRMIKKCYWPDGKVLNQGKFNKNCYTLNKIVFFILHQRQCSDENKKDYALAGRARNTSTLSVLFMGRRTNDNLPFDQVQRFVDVKHFIPPWVFAYQKWTTKS